MARCEQHKRLVKNFFELFFLQDEKKNHLFYRNKKLGCSLSLLPQKAGMQSNTCIFLGALPFKDKNGSQVD